MRVAIDRETGDYDTFRRWLVFEDESTELEFPDGSTLRNDFSRHQTNPDIEESLFELEAGEDWEVVHPLDGKG